MSLQRVVCAAMICGGLLGGGGTASAQEWWNPATWFTPPAYRSAPVYGGCANGQCTPTYRYAPANSVGYAPVNSAAASCNCPNGTCNRGTCGPKGCRPANYGNSAQPSVVPVYRSPAPYSATLTPASRTTNYRLPAPSRTRPSPFYE